MKKKKNSNQSAKIIFIIFAFVIIGLIFNILYLAYTGKHLISGENIREYSANLGGGQVETTLYAKRGSIYSSDNEVIASDVKKYKLIATLRERTKVDGTPAYVVDKELTAKSLSKILKMKEKKVLKTLKQDKGQVEFGTYGNNLSSLIKDKIEALNLPGLEFEEMTSRNYRYGDFASYEVGYAQLMEKNNIKELVGQMGLEKIYNDQLTGTNGKKVCLVDSNKYVLPNGVLSEEQPVSGNDIYLTIDSDIQTELDLRIKELAKEMDIDKGACAIMEAKTGRILAVSNYPSFDPNKKNLKNYTDLFFNEAIEPGSVFKSFVYANGLTNGKLNLKTKYQSGIYNYTVNGKVIHKIKDHNQGKGWGTISLEEGYYHSSNTAICQILTKYVKKESLMQDFEDLKFFQPSTIDGIKSAGGIAGYKGEYKNLEWLTTGFGQGSTVTGLQLLRGYSAFANDGKTVEPYLIDKIVNPTTNEVVYQGKSEFSKQIYSTNAVKKMRDLMSGVVNSKGGTGKSYHMDDIHMIGKTGTGQVPKNGKYLKNYNTHGFAGLAPYDDPKIVIISWYQCKKTGNDAHSKMIKAVVRVALNKLNEQPVKEIKTSTYTLDSYLNQSVSFVKKTLSRNNLTTEVVGDGNIVVDQYPKASTKVPTKTRVFIQSNGTNITMPSMEGWSRKETEAFASMANVNVEFKGIGNVYKQSIEKGTTLKNNQKIVVEAK